MEAGLLHRRMYCEIGRPTPRLQLCPNWSWLFSAIAFQRSKRCVLTLVSVHAAGECRRNRSRVYESFGLWMLVFSQNGAKNERSASSLALLVTMRKAQFVEVLPKCLDYATKRQFAISKCVSTSVRVRLEVAAQGAVEWLLEYRGGWPGFKTCSFRIKMVGDGSKSRQ